jgi:uncharacterized membrane protein
MSASGELKWPDAEAALRGSARALRWLTAGPVLSPVISFLAGAIVAVGPWVVSVIALAVISAALTPVLGHRAIEDLRLAVIYAFGLSLLTTAPIGTLTARLIRNSVNEHGGRRVAELYAVSLMLGAGATQLLTATVAVLLGGLSLQLGVAFVVLSVSASLLWTDFAVMSALRDFWRLIRSFVLGMVIAIGGAVFVARGNSGVEPVLWSFSVGLLFAHFLMSSHLIRSSELDLARLLEAAGMIVAEIREQVLLFAGIVLAVCAVWVDKLVFWFGPVGMRSASGFPHFAPYDSAMFIAHLSIIPTFAAIFLLNERLAEPRIDAFWQLLRARPTYRAMATEADRLFDDILTAIFRILFVQAAFSALFVELSAHIVMLLSMEMRQLAWMRIGLVAALLQSFFFANCFVIMLCNRARRFFQLQVIFGASNLVAGILAYWWTGVSAYGVFVASLVSCLVSFVFAYGSLRSFLFIVFIRENAALYEQRPAYTLKNLG